MVKADYRRSYYTSVLDLDSSNDGENVVGINSFGEIFTFPSPIAGRTSLAPIDATVYSMAETANCLKSVGQLVLCGQGDGHISGYKWSSLAAGKSGEQGTVLAPDLTISSVRASVNDLLGLSGGSQLLLGCGDGSIALVDLESQQKVLRVYNPHSQQVNRIAKRGENEVVSCSSDGTVALCDLRIAENPCKSIRVTAEKKVLREGYSRAVIAIDVMDDFIVCGGGVKLAAWHLPSCSMVTLLEEAESQERNACSPIYMDTKMIDGQILAGGFGSDQLYRFNHAHEHISTISLSKSMGVNCIHSPSNGPTNNLTLVAGESPRVHCLTDFGYVSSVVDLSRLQGQ